MGQWAPNLGRNLKIGNLDAPTLAREPILTRFQTVPNQSRLLQTHGTGYTTASRYALSAPPAPEKDQRPQQSYDQKNARRVLTVSHWAPGNGFSGYAQVGRTHYARASDEMYALVRMLRRRMLCDTDRALFTNAAHW